jgi:hypothetical protein
MRAPGRAEASFSQGERWNRLISKYIVVMPPKGRMRGAGAQSANGASCAVIHAMNAKLGDAAKTSQPACPALVLALIAAG